MEVDDLRGIFLHEFDALADYVAPGVEAKPGASPAARTVEPA